MKSSGLDASVRYLRALFDAGPVVELSDGQLLERFVTRRESAYLEALLVRHGQMVWGACLRILRDHHDAEDAFQATFLVLARKAASIVPREKVGNWLYGVACQTARKARATRAKRQLREGQVPDAPEPESASHPPRNELAEWLDLELSRLPEKYRIPIVLCELEGKTHGEAAEQLGCPVGTVSGRLSRGRSMLADRLSRRGVAVAGGALAMLVAVTPGAASAQLLSATAKAACLFASGQVAPGVVSTEVAALTGEVLKTMTLSRIKIAAAVLLTISLAGAGLWQAKTWAGGRPPPRDDPLGTTDREPGSKARPHETFRVTVDEVVKDEGAVVLRIGLDVLPGSKLEVQPEKQKRDTGSVIITSDASDPARPKAPAVQLFVLANHVQAQWKGGSANAVKFLLGHKVGSISSSSSETIPMPAGARHLGDVLKVKVKSGDLEYGKDVELLAFNGVRYNLVVSKTK